MKAKHGAKQGFDAASYLENPMKNGDWMGFSQQKWCLIEILNLQ